jgi:hypothetical protein
MTVTSLWLLDANIKLNNLNFSKLWEQTCAGYIIKYFAIKQSCCKLSSGLQQSSVDFWITHSPNAGHFELQELDGPSSEIVKVGLIVIGR